MLSNSEIKNQQANTVSILNKYESIMLNRAMIA